MGARVSRKDFTYSYSDEPHATRRKIILQKYPQIKKLMGVDSAFKWQVFALVLAQISSFFFLRHIKNFWILFPMAYCIGGVANHAIMLAIHEISHGMGFGIGRPVANKILSIFANLPLGIPMSISFKKYHLEHHRYQGDELLDTDVPTRMEAAFFTTPLRKGLWCFLQPLFYTLRPLFVHPKPLEQLELTNIIVQIVFDLLIISTCGWHILAYMIGGSLLAMGLHPVAGHFISEHTLMFHDDKDKAKTTTGNKKQDAKCEVQSTTETNGKGLTLDHFTEVNGSNQQQDNEKLTNGAGDKQNRDQYSEVQCDKIGKTVNDEGKFLIPETCSYYGPLNWLTFNVGYHVEHHDFPSIPGSRLYKLSEIAPEFYLNLHYHTSWTRVLWQYITDPKVSPSARVRRPHSLRNSKEL